MHEPYATFTHGRAPYFKLHSKLSHATGALANNRRSGCIIYEHQNGRWVQIARVEQNHYGVDPNTSPMPQKCDGCGLNTLESHRHWARPVNTAEQYLERRNGKLVKPLNVLTLCVDCKRGMGY